MATLITPENIEGLLACMDPTTTQRVLRVMAKNFPQDFMAIVQRKRTAEFLEESKTPPTKNRTIEEFENNPDLKETCAQAATNELNEGKTIMAIKIVRQIAGIGLKDARDFVVSLPACKQNLFEFR